MVKIIAISESGVEYEISDNLYFFEENGISDFLGGSVSGKWSFRIEILGVKYSIVDGVAVLQGGE